MFQTSEPFLLFDYFRVPYGILDTCEDKTLGRLQGTRTMLWARPESAGRPPLLRLGDVIVPAHAVNDDALPALIRREGWQKLLELKTENGTYAASIRVNSDGDLFLPFDPSEAIRNYWSERYVRDTATPRGFSAADASLRAYYALRPLVPRRVQIGMRRAFSVVQRRQAFPQWPIEPSLHNMYDVLFELVARVVDTPVPRLAPWPAGRTWALVLTHDVESASGRDMIERLRAVERRHGLRSSWNFVPKRYDVPPSLVRRLHTEGCEIGVHGLYHDGRDLESRERLLERLPDMLESASRWSAVGFRSPATHREWRLMPLLPFLYDSSYPDTDPFEPVAGGACTWLPFFIEQLLELPITLPQDHTLFAILQRNGASTWIEKASYLRSRGGMALLITHPDYNDDGSLSVAYGEFLDSFAADPTVWHALPREVATWWRQRAETTIQLHDGTLTAVGPASTDAAVELVRPRPNSSGILVERLANATADSGWGSPNNGAENASRS